MTTIERSEFKTDPVFRDLYETILANYQIAPHTRKVLLENRDVKDFCEESRHFVELPGNPSIYFHFDVSSWYSPEGILTKVERIGIYDDFQEYESTRLRALHSAIHSNGVNLN